MNEFDDGTREAGDAIAGFIYLAEEKGYDIASPLPGTWNVPLDGSYRLFTWVPQRSKESYLSTGLATLRR